MAAWLRVKQLQPLGSYTCKDPSQLAVIVFIQNRVYQKKYIRLLLNNRILFLPSGIEDEFSQEEIIFYTPTLLLIQQLNLKAPLLKSMNGKYLILGKESNLAK